MLQTRILLLLLLFFITPFNTLAATESGQLFNIKIPSSKANVALKKLARLTEYSLLFKYSEVDDVSTNSVNGNYSLTHALKILLKGTKLTSRLSDKKMIIITHSLDQLGNTQKELSQLEDPLLISEVVTISPTIKKKTRLQTKEKIETITVTAMRRQTSIQETAMSVAAYSGKELEEKGYTSIEQFVDMVPGVTALSDGPLTNRIIIRNIATSTQEGGSAVIATYFDDFAVSGDSGTANFRLVDMERVEILKGPQGTLYGRSAMGGVIRYISNKARTDTIEGGINVYGASVTDGGDELGGHAYVNLPLTDTLAIRVVGYNYENAGFIDNDELGVEDHNNSITTGGRLALHWDATESLSLDVTYLNQSIDAAANWVTTTFDPGNLAVVGDEGPDIPFELKARNQMGGVVMEQTNNKEILNFNVTAQFDLFDATLLAINSKDDGDFVFDNRPYVNVKTGCVCDIIDPTNNARGADTEVVELRLVSSDEQFVDWIVGAYYEDSTNQWAQTVNYYGPDQLAFGSVPITDGWNAINTNGEVKGNEKALYGELGFSFTSDTHLTLGYRRSDVEFSSMQTEASGGFNQLLGDDAITGILFETQEDVNTYKFALEHRINDDMFVYGTASSGYRRGGFNQPTLISDFSTYDSDKLWNYEAGIKSTWLAGHLVANIAVYLIDYTDIQLVVQDPTTFNRGTQNIGEATVTGIELSLAYQVNDYMDVSLSGALSAPKLQEDVPGGVTGKKGDRLPGSAKENYAINVNWFQPVSGDWDLYANGSFKYVGARLNDFNLDLDVALPSYQLVDLRIGVRNDDAGYSIALYANNVFDEAVLYSIDRQGSSFESASTNRPRTVGVNFAYNF